MNKPTVPPVLIAKSAYLWENKRIYGSRDNRALRAAMLHAPFKLSNGGRIHPVNVCSWRYVSIDPGSPAVSGSK